MTIRSLERWPHWSSPDGTIILVNADALEVLPEIEPGGADCVLIDPPYGSGGRDGSVHLQHETRNNRMSSDAYVWFIRQVATQLIRITKSDTHVYVFSDWRQYKKVQIAFESVGWECRSLIVWNKGCGMGEFWRSSHEFVLFFTKRKPRKLSTGGCFNVLTYSPVPPAQRTHPHEKPLALITHLITASTGPRSVVLDMFLGSGTTLAACAKLGLGGIGVEADPVHFATAKARIEEEIRLRDGTGPLLKAATLFPGGNP